MSIDKIRTSCHFVVTEQLMARIASGDEEAFSILYDGTRKSVFAYILALVKDRNLAEDFMQDTYISIRKSISLYQPRQKPMAWIFTIARNHVYTYFRRQKCSTEYNDELSYHDEWQGKENDQIENMVLLTALHKLNEKERTIIILNAINGYKFKEIAAYLDIPLGTALANYHRGMMKLKKELREVIE